MTEQTDRKLQQQVLLGRRVEGDRLMLSDDTLRAALAGARHLTQGERSALQASPLTLRRLRTLSLQRAASWQGSRGMLRAASTAAALETITTDDGFWALHFVPAAGRWRVVLVLAAVAPFAARLLANRPPLQVRDAEGRTILRGSLDADGEYEADWPFDASPCDHFQQNGAAFSVEPVQ